MNELTEIKTDLAILKKVIYGNGVKGMAQKVDEITDGLGKLELTMNEKIQESFDAFEEKLIQATNQRKNMNIQNIAVVVSVTALIVQSVLGFIS